jgi:hypothetical protein
MTVANVRPKRPMNDGWPSCAAAALSGGQIVAVVPILADVDAAVAENSRAAESGLRGGILIPVLGSRRRCVR